MKKPTKWDSKLSFEDRCGFYAAILDKIPRDIVQAASGLDRSCVARLAEPKYKAYRSVKDLYKTVGINRFFGVYYTQEIKIRLAAAALATGAAAGVYAHPAPVYDHPRPVYAGRGASGSGRTQRAPRAGHG